MKRLYLLGLLAMSCLVSPANSAPDSEIVTEMAKQCWKMPEGASYERASASFELTYNSQGELERIAAIDYQPVRKAGEEFALSAQEALLECATKTPVRNRTIRVIMRYSAPLSDGGLLRKRSLR